MSGGKRGSGPPRRPRNPIAKAVRTPQFKPRVVPDKRRQERRSPPQHELPDRHETEAPPED